MGILTRQKIYQQKLKLEVIAAYGGKCSCCAETELDFLAIDHIGEDGNAHRKLLGGKKIYFWLKTNDYPPGFQVLCHNCNFSKHFNNGICFHKLIENRVVVQLLEKRILLYKEHGNSQCYNKGCRCKLCKQTHTNRQNKYRVKLKNVGV